MIVAVDIGNSNVVVGLHDEDKWQHFWRMPTQKNDDRPVYYEVEIRNLILEHRVDISEVRGIVLSTCLLYTSPSPRDQRGSRMPSSA